MASFAALLFCLPLVLAQQINLGSLNLRRSPFTGDLQLGVDQGANIFGFGGERGLELDLGRDRLGAKVDNGIFLGGQRFGLDSRLGYQQGQGLDLGSFLNLFQPVGQLLHGLGGRQSPPQPNAAFRRGFLAPPPPSPSVVLPPSAPAPAILPPNPNGGGGGRGLTTGVVADSREQFPPSEGNGWTDPSTEGGGKEGATGGGGEEPAAAAVWPPSGMGAGPQQQKGGGGERRRVTTEGQLPREDGGHRRGEGARGREEMETEEEEEKKKNSGINDGDTEEKEAPAVQKGRKGLPVPDGLEPLLL